MSKEQNHIVLGSGDLTLDAWGNQVVVKRISKFGSLFTFDVPAAKWEARLNETELDLSLDPETDLPLQNYCYSDIGMMHLTTPGISGDITYIHSRRHVEYQSNRGQLISFGLIIPTPTDNAAEDWGAFTESNGCFFRCMPITGDLYACIQSGGVLWYNEKIQGLPEDFDLNAKNNIYDIQFQWRSAGDFKWFVGKKGGTIKLVHHANFLGTLEATSMENPSLPAAYRVTSLGDAGFIKSACCDITSEGGRIAAEQYENSFSGPQTVLGTNQPIIVIRSPLLIKGTTNTRDIKLLRIIINADKKTTFTIWTTRDTTSVVPVGAWNRETGGTFIQHLHGPLEIASVDIAKMRVFTSINVEANAQGKFEYFIDVPIWFIHGDYLVVTAGTGVTADVLIEWAEEI